MEIEEIDDNSSQDAICPATTPLPAKKRTKTKRNPPTVPPSSTLTRFLGPLGTPSISVWEDANRQCPVCQQSGFSSRSLALHVNNCLDARNGSKADVGKGTARAGEQAREATTAAAVAAAGVLAGAAPRRSSPSSCSARTADERANGNPSSSARTPEERANGNPRTGSSGNRNRAMQVSREPNRTTKRGMTEAVDSIGEQVPRPKKTAKPKTGSAHQGQPRTAERSGASTRVLNCAPNQDVPARVVLFAHEGTLAPERPLVPESPVQLISRCFVGTEEKTRYLKTYANGNAKLP